MILGLLERRNKEREEREGVKMHKEDPVCNKPSDLNTKVWRYIDFAKLVSLLSRSQLFFPRADRLGDPFEGSYPKKNVAKRSEESKELGNELAKYIPSMLSKIFKKWCSYTFISCWHLNNYESAAMWKLYLQGGEGIAIQSTVKRLCDSFRPCKQDVYVGLVDYVDYDEDLIGNSPLSSFLHKRKSFEHEREVRAIFQKKVDILAARLPRKQKRGYYLAVDLSILVERVYVSPFSQDWFFELVKSIITTYKMNFEVRRSRLEDDPVY